MKKYFLYSILAIIVIAFLASVLSVPKETREKIFNNLYILAQFDGGDMGGTGTGTGSESGQQEYDIDYADGECKGVYCFSGANTQPCPDDLQIKANQQKIVDLRDVMLYFKNRALTEDKDFQTDIEKVLNKKIKWYEDKIASERQVLNQLPDGAEKDLSQAIINILEEEKTKLEKERTIKQQLRAALVELAEKIPDLPKPIEELVPLPDQCLANVREKCTATCQGGCHDTLGCCYDTQWYCMMSSDSGGGMGGMGGGGGGGGMGGGGGDMGGGFGDMGGGGMSTGMPGCSGGNPCPMSEIKNKVEAIEDVNDDIRAIANRIIQLVNSLASLAGAPPAGTTTTATTTCDNPQEIAKQNNEPYPRKRSASVNTLISCIANNIGQAVPGEGGSNAYYGSLYTYEHTNELCNYTRGQRTCGNCAHAVNSCHYGGGSGTDGALAIDFGNEANGDRIIQAALACGAKAARCENASSQTVACSNASANHIHVTDPNCDRI